MSFVPPNIPTLSGVTAGGLSIKAWPGLFYRVQQLGAPTGGDFKVRTTQPPPDVTVTYNDVEATIQANFDAAYGPDEIIITGNAEDFQIQGTIDYGFYIPSSTLSGGTAADPKVWARLAPALEVMRSDGSLLLEVNPNGTIYVGPERDIPYITSGVRSGIVISTTEHDSNIVTVRSKHNQSWEQIKAVSEDEVYQASLFATDLGSAEVTVKNSDPAVGGSATMVSTQFGGTFIGAQAAVGQTDDLCVLKDHSNNKIVHVKGDQKIGFHGATPVDQAVHPTTLADVITILTNLGLCSA